MTKLNKICLHWTGGTNFPCDEDLNAYHFLIDKDGKIYDGEFTPEDNIDCYDGKYAKHCGGGNTGCIGVSLCGMHKFNLVEKQTKYPLAQKQVETMCELVAHLCKKYDIKIENVFTHYEFDKKKTKPEGKSDIAYLPYQTDLKEDEVGSYLRNKVLWYRLKIEK